MKKVMLSIKQFFARLFGSKKQEAKSKVVEIHIEKSMSNGAAAKTVFPDEEEITNWKKQLPIKSFEVDEKFEENKSDSWETEQVQETPNKPIPIQLNYKQAWMLAYVQEQTIDGSWIGPSKVGRQWGWIVKNRKGYNSGHSRRVLLDLVEMGRLVKNKDGQYRIV